MVSGGTGRGHGQRSMLLGAALAIFTAVNLLPIIHAVLTSLKHPVDAFAVPTKWIFEPTLAYHRAIWLEKDFGWYLANSAIIALGTVAISVPVGTLAAYALSRIRTRRSQALLFGLLAIRMFPRMLLVIPFFVMAKVLGLFDTRTIVVLAMVAFNQPFAIWLMRGFFLDIPIELDEAARIDGCTSFQVFWRVVLPVVRPGLVATTLFSLLLAYNEFLFPLILTGTEAKPLPVAISEYGAENIEYWSLSAAGAIGIMAPIVLFMILVQRHIVRGLTFGALKG
jgi:multiple sugar transport system permease protein